MNCVFCKMAKISPNKVPYGGYLCASGHMQCTDCTTQHNGRCSLCGNATNFIHMSLNPLSQNLAAAQARMAMSAVGQYPSAPVLSISDSPSVENPSMYIHSQSMLAEVENHSSISQEHLSMNGSKEEDGSLKSTLESPVTDAHIDNMKGRSSNEGGNATTIFTSKERFAQSDFVSPITGDQTNVGPFQNSSLEADASTTNRELLKTSKAMENLKIYTSDRVTYPQFPIADINDTFVFQEDRDDHNVNHASQISFMDLTESMNNLLELDSIQKSEARSFTGGLPKMFSPPSINNVEAQNQVELQKGALSTKHLQEHNSRNIGPSNEVVEQYLQMYGPMATYQFPSYNCQQPHCDFHWNFAPQEASTQSISVSTESEPSLRSVQPKSTTTEGGLHNKFGNQNYVVMHATGVGSQTTHNIVGLDKFGRPSLDMCMQRLIETFQEDPKIPKVTEKLDPSKGKFIKFPNPGSNKLHDNQLTNFTEQQTLMPQRNTLSANDPNAFVALLLNTHRAVYQRTDHMEPLVCNFKNLSTSPPGYKDPPPAQFQSIICSSSDIHDLISAKANLLNIKPAVTRHMPPLPIQCPDTKCSCMIFLSDFHKHFEVDHSQLPMERLTPFQCKNLLLDPRVDRCGSSKCHYLYLLRDKITGLGSSQYMNFLPLLVMTSRISLAQMCGINEAATPKVSKPLVEFLVIWITGIVPEEFPISVSITVWPRTGIMPSCHLVHSGDMYSIRKSQRGLDVVDSGHMLMLSPPEVDRLTKGGTELLNVQLIVH